MAAVACRPLPPLAVSGAVAVGGLGALLARPWLVEAGEGHTARLVLFLAIGGVGCWWPLPRTATAPLRLSLAVFALGSLAFTLGRLAVGPPPPSEDVAAVLVLNAVAAVAEEAFFRRMLYGLLLRWGTAVAVLASAAGFAVAHVTGSGTVGTAPRPRRRPGPVLAARRLRTVVGACRHPRRRQHAGLPVRVPMTKRAVLLSLVAVMAGACAPADERNTVVIGAVYPVSGRQGPGGVDEANGARLAVELANARGGVHGRRVRLELVDVDSGGGAAAALARLHRQGVELVLGSYGSTISAPAAVAARRTGMLFWETGAVGELAPDAGPGESFFRMAPMGTGLGRAAVAFVRDQLSPLLGAGAPFRYAVAYVDDAYGRAVGHGAIEEIRASSQALAGAFPYRAQSLDATALVRTIAAAQPDVLFVSAYFDDGVAIRRATVTEGLALRASIGTSSSYCMPAFAAALGPAAIGLFASDKPDAAQLRDDGLRPGARTALSWARQRFHREHGEDMSSAALSGFANAWALLGHVLPASPRLTAQDVAATARSLKLDPGTLPNGAGLDLRNGENRAAVSVIWQWVDAKTQAVVWPPAFATRPLEAIPILP